MDVKQQRTYIPQKYYNQYYSNPQGHQQQKMGQLFGFWMHQAFEIIPPCQFGLQISCGSVLILSAYASRKIKNIILTEYNTQCFNFLQPWIKDQYTTLNLLPHFQKINKLQGKNSNIAQRLRNSIFLCSKINLYNQNIFQYPVFRKFDVIIGSLCIQPVARSQEEYQQIIKKLTKHLRPQGYFFLVGVLQQTFYKVEEKKISCLPIHQNLVTNIFEKLGFKIIKFNAFRPKNSPQETSNFKGLYSILCQFIGKNQS